MELVQELITSGLCALAMASFSLECNFPGDADPFGPDNHHKQINRDKKDENPYGSTDDPDAYVHFPTLVFTLILPVQSKPNQSRIARELARNSHLVNYRTR